MVATIESVNSGNGHHRGDDPVSNDALFSRERLGESPGIFLISFPPGEGRPSLGRSMALAALDRLLRTIGFKADLFDAQEHIVDCGRVVVADLLDRVEQQSPDVLGLSIPQGGWHHALSFLIQLERGYADREEDRPTVILGNNVPTDSYREILEMFPWVVVVKGEGEIPLKGIVERLSKGENLEGIGGVAYYKDPNDETSLVDKPFTHFPIDRYYAVEGQPYVPLPDKEMFKELILAQGGIIRVRASIGCPKAERFSPCAFCPRTGDDPNTGEPWRTVPVEWVEQELIAIKEAWEELRVEDRGPDHLAFEFTDEEFLGPTEASEPSGDFDYEANRQRIGRLAQAIEGLGVEAAFTISTRSDYFNQADSAGLIAELVAAGLKKVYFGFEGGDDVYLNRCLRKALTVQENEQALESARNHGLEIEFGYITFHWRMTLKQLGKNLAWLSLGEPGMENWRHASSVLNVLDVRPRTHEEEQLRRYLENRRETLEEHRRDHYNIDLSRYDTPYEDENVLQVVEPIERWKYEQRGVYFALKALERAGLAPNDGLVEQCLQNLKQLDLNLAVVIYNLVEAGESGDEIRKELEKFRRARRAVITSLDIDLRPGNIEDMGGILSKELERFFQEERGREIPRPHLTGVALVIHDKRGRILLVRASGEGEWGYLSEKSSATQKESCEEAAERALEEELGIEASSLEPISSLPFYTHNEEGPFHDPKGHVFDGFTLHHLLARIELDLVDARQFGAELADAIWLTPEEIIEEAESGRLKLKLNVPMALVEAKKSYASLCLNPEEKGFTMDPYIQNDGF